MKKLLGIVVLGLLFCGSAYAEQTDNYKINKYEYYQYLENLYLKARNIHNQFSKIEQKKARKVFCNEFLITTEKEINKFSRIIKKIPPGKKRGLLVKNNRIKKRVMVNQVRAVVDGVVYNRQGTLFNSYEILKCTQVLGGLDQVVTAPKNSTKTLTGFKIDLVNDNDELKKKFQKYEIIFDFKKFEVHQFISFQAEKSDQLKDIKRSFEIISIDNNNILMQETIGDFLLFCQNTKLENLRESEVKLFNSNSIIEECNTTKLGFSKFNVAERYKQCKNCWSHGSTIDDPYVYMNLNLKNRKINKQYWPLLAPAFKEEYLNLFSNSNIELNKPLDKTNFEKTIEFLFWVATVYLIFDQIDSIKDITKSSNHSNKISPGTSSSSFSSNPANWSNPTTPLGYSRKIKILKHFGRLR